MTRTLELPEELWARLEARARTGGYTSIEDYLASTHPDQAVLAKRRETFNRIKEFREEMATKYGVHPDSVPLIREDRER